jgi:hypothetical protein
MLILMALWMTIGSKGKLNTRSLRNLELKDNIKFVVRQQRTYMKARAIIFDSDPTIARYHYQVIPWALPRTNLYWNLK